MTQKRKQAETIGEMDLTVPSVLNRAKRIIALTQNPEELLSHEAVRMMLVTSNIADFKAFMSLFYQAKKHGRLWLRKPVYRVDRLKRALLIARIEQHEANLLNTSSSTEQLTNDNEPRPDQRASVPR